MSTYDIWLERPYQDQAEREARREDWIEERAQELMDRLATDSNMRNLPTIWIIDSLDDGQLDDLIFNIIYAYAQREDAPSGYVLHKVMREPLWQWACERAEKEWQEEHA